MAPKKQKEMVHVRANYIGALGLIATCYNKFDEAGKLFFKAIELDPGEGYPYTSPVLTRGFDRE